MIKKTEETLTKKKDRQAKAYRDLRKWQRKTATNLNKELSKKQEEEAKKETLKPLSIEQQEQLVAFLKGVLERCTQIHYQQANTLREKLEKGEDDWKTYFAECHQSIGRETAYELILKSLTNESYQKYLLKTGDEWSKKDDKKE